MTPTAPRKATAHRGPLSGIRVVELGGIGPGPFAGMLLGDLGAEVIRIDRPQDAGKPNPHPILHRNRRSVTIDLKHGQGTDVVLALIDTADAVIEGFRPGVAERLGIGPYALLARNPALAYGRMTGWGQDGPLAAEPGHDINFIALSGALHAIGPADEPVVPLNLIGDMGGGGMLLAFGLLAGILSARSTGRGQVVDAAMTDGSATLLAMIHGFLNAGGWEDERERNSIDGGSPCYGVYRCADDRHVALGIGDERSYGALLQVLRLEDDPDFADRRDSTAWRAMRKTLGEVFGSRDRDAWERVFAGRGACVTPVLSLTEAPRHPHNHARGTFRTGPDGAIEPAPAPRFSGTPAAEPSRASVIGSDTENVLAEVGYVPGRIAGLRAQGVIA
ncbi:CaiB/BaiF CoA transferase family protein [Rhodococcus koreensis]|uniref:CaiB/BaiF CoA transferase family protein n=1 Tax=Rhodococcus koreensis TaxID=99653 RepID=UPI0019815F06|nr:CaiB/BaiF CoA-transferase family protein [Rhodococcus koreensis]QSE78136.1 CoA transferase [Rhodococcus koreensis]